MELLPKTLEEFATGSSGLGLQQGTLTAVYQEYERQRKGKWLTTHKLSHEEMSLVTIESVFLVMLSQQFSITSL